MRMQMARNVAEIQFLENICSRSDEFKGFETPGRVILRVFMHSSAVCDLK
jgi:hypothetical protein